ncbi:alcohol oxidase [Apiospora phragmitis]|uniref:Alcohol oxidase n=1 Tax=Apiospora phragmitis TaxID=2905665 RepID=A0ABR1X6Y6_9PEZI
MHLFSNLLLANLALAQCASDPHNPFRSLGSSLGVPGRNQPFEYVIVGGGTAGNVLADRLVEDPRGFTVAVVETGGFSFFENGKLTEFPDTKTGLHLLTRLIEP